MKEGLNEPNGKVLFQRIIHTGPIFVVSVNTELQTDFQQNKKKLILEPFHLY